MSHDAEALRLLQAAGGGGDESVRPADQQVTGGWIAAAFRANIPKLRQLRPDGTPQGCREEYCCHWDDNKLRLFLKPDPPVYNALTKQYSVSFFCFQLKNPEAEQTCGLFI